MSEVYYECECRGVRIGKNWDVLQLLFVVQLNDHATENELQKSASQIWCMQT